MSSRQPWNGYNRDTVVKYTESHRKLILMLQPLRTTQDRAEEEHFERQILNFSTMFTILFPSSHHRQITVRMQELSHFIQASGVLQNNISGSLLPFANKKYLVG